MFPVYQSKYVPLARQCDKVGAANHNQPLTQSDCRPIQLVAGRVGRTLIPLTYLLTRIRNIFIFGSGTDPV